MPVPVSLIVPRTLLRTAWNAGASPNSSAVTADGDRKRGDAAVEVELRPRRYLVAGGSYQEMQRPAARTSGRRRCRQHQILEEQLTREARPAGPDASPIAISRRRTRARASMMLATLAHVTTSRRVTATSSVLAADKFARTVRAAPGRTARRSGRCRAPSRSVPAFSGDPASRHPPNARFQPAEAFGAVALALLVRVAGERDPQPNLAGNSAVRGTTPTIVCGIPFSFTRAERVVGRAEPLAPEPFADDRDSRRLRLVLFRPEHPADERLDAEHPREVGGDTCPVDTLRWLPSDRLRLAVSNTGQSLRTSARMRATDESPDS